MDSMPSWRAGTPSERRRSLRAASTDAERALWLILRQLEGHKFRRQHSAGPYILDFYCAARRLAVEVDGSQHDTASGRADDAGRTAYLEALGMRVLRFTNVEVLANAEGVAFTVLCALEREIA